MSTSPKRRPKKRVPRPGDVIRLTTSHWDKKGSEWVVTEATYTNGTRFATSNFAWVQPHECVFVRRATDSEYLAALRAAERGDADPDTDNP